MCLTTKTRIDAETETLIPTHGGGFDAVAYPINTQIAMRHNALGRNTGFGVGEPGDPAFTLLRDHHHAAATTSAVRRLTPRECERLQGFPDDYTAIPWRKKPAEQCPDGPRYKALGNSMAVPVMRWIGERIQQVENINQ
jgi:DNA (cytosine-5)-methyltransferase 1